MLLTHLLIIYYSNFADSPIGLKRKTKDNLPFGEIHCSVLSSRICAAVNFSRTRDEI